MTPPLKCRLDGRTKSEEFVQCLPQESLPSDFNLEEDARMFQDIEIFLKNKSHIYFYVYSMSICEIKWPCVIHAYKVSRSSCQHLFHLAVCFLLASLSSEALWNTGLPWKSTGISGLKENPRRWPQTGPYKRVQIQRVNTMINIL